MMSDHVLMHTEIELPKDSDDKPVKIPNKKTARAISLKLLSFGSWSMLHADYPSKRSRLTTSKLSNMHEAVKKERFAKTLKDLKDSDLDTIASNLAADWQKAKDSTIKTITIGKDTKKAWKTLQKMMSFNNSQGIVNKIRLDDDSVISGSTMRDQLIGKYQAITNSIDEMQDSYVEWPSDTYISKDEVIAAIYRLPVNKALTADCISDKLFKFCCKNETLHKCSKDITRISLAEECFTREFWAHKKANVHLIGRIIPLNKAHPAVPTLDDVRFIVAISPVQKLVEAFLLVDLQLYAHTHLKKYQRGYISGGSTHSNIIDILDPVNRSKDILLIDFSKAFDTVDRTLLYEIIRYKKILSPTKLDILLHIHGNSRTEFDGKSIKTTRGVPQGSLISPLLFNIYIASLLKRMNDFGLTRAFADDIAIAINKDVETTKVIDTIVNWSDQNMMALNRGKSGIISKRRRTGSDIKGIPVCESYNYLGVLIDSSLSIKPHLKHLRKSLFNKCIMIRKLTNKSTIFQKLMLFQILIKPIIMYATPATESTNRLNHHSQLKAIHRKCIRIVLCIGMNVKNTIVNAIELTENATKMTTDITLLVITFNRAQCGCSNPGRMSSRHLADIHDTQFKYEDIEN